MIKIFVVPNVELVIFSKASHFCNFQPKLLIPQRNNGNDNYSFLITTCHALGSRNVTLIQIVFIFVKVLTKMKYGVLCENIIEGPNSKRMKQIFFEK